MATKTITAWINGATQTVTVNEITTYLGDDGLDERVNALEGKTVTITTITLPASAWEGSTSPYYQTIELSVSVNSMIDLQPSPDQLASWQDDGFAFTATNDNGVVKVYVSGGLPTEDITVQVKIQEVDVI